MVYTNRIIRLYREQSGRLRSSNLGWRENVWKTNILCGMISPPRRQKSMPTNWQEYYRNFYSGSTLWKVSRFLKNLIHIFLNDLPFNPVCRQIIFHHFFSQIQNFSSVKLHTRCLQVWKIWNVWKKSGIWKVGQEVCTYSGNSPIF